MPPMGPWPSHFSGRFHGILLTLFGSSGLSLVQAVIKTTVASARRIPRMRGIGASVSCLATLALPA